MPKLLLKLSIKTRMAYFSPRLFPKALLRGIDSRSHSSQGTSYVENVNDGINPSKSQPNQAQGFEANYVSVHESQAVLAEETHSQCACSKCVSSWAGTASQCPGELSVCSAHGIPGPVPDARLCPLPERGLGEWLP